MPKSQPKPSRALAAAICKALVDKKAEDLKVLDVSETSSITDFLVIATGNSETHLRALRIELDQVLKDTGSRVVGRDEVRESGWSVVDAFDVMVHLFLAEKRQFFGLERLWRDADEVSVQKLLTPVEATPSSLPKVRRAKGASSGKRSGGGAASTKRQKP